MELVRNDGATVQPVTRIVGCRQREVHERQDYRNKILQEYSQSSNTMQT